MQNSKRRLARYAHATGALTLLSGFMAHAATTTYTFTGGDTADPLNFQQPTNFSANLVPTTGNSVLFNATGLSTGATVDVNGSSTIDGLVFNGAPAFTLGNSQGGTLTLDANGGNIITTTAAQTSLVTISTNLQFAPVTPAASLQLTASTVAATANTLQVNITGTIGDSSAATGIATGFLKIQNGAMELSGTNTFTGAVTIRAGYLEIAANAPVSAAGALGNSATPIQVGDAGTGANANPGLLSAGSVTIARDIAVVAGSGNTYNPVLGGTSATASSLFTGAIGLARTSSATFIQSNNTGSLTTEIQGVVSGSGAITKTAPGNLQLDNSSNSYTGITTIRNGSLIIAGNAPSGANGVLGNATSAIVLGDTTAGAAGTISLLTNGNYTIGRNITVVANASNLNTQLGGFVTQTAGSTFSGNVTLNRNLQLLSYTTSGNAITYSGGISSAVSGTGIQSVGPGTSSLTGIDTYSGATSVGTDGLDGTLTVDSSIVTAAALSNTSSITVAPGATFRLVSAVSNGATNLINDAASLVVSSSDGAGTAPLSHIQLDLSNSTETVGSFIVDGVAQPAGIYGSAAYFSANRGVVESSSALADVGYFGNGDGAISVPEPGIFAFVTIGGMVLRRRRRRSVSL